MQSLGKITLEHERNSRKSPLRIFSINWDYLCTTEARNGYIGSPQLMTVIGSGIFITKKCDCKVWWHMTVTEQVSGC